MRTKVSIKRFFIYGLFLLLGFVLLYAQAEVKPTAKATLLQVDGAIGPATQDFISRSLEKSQEINAKMIILQIDTPGGLSKSMRGIIKDMLASPVPVIVYVAPSGARAASAGTYILYAAQIAAMAPGTNLGAATPVAIGGPGMAPKGKDDKSNKKGAKKALTASEKKALNDARAYIRSLAQLRGRNVKWAEKAVLEGESLSANEALKLNVIDLVAKNIPDLLQKVDGKVVKVQGQSVTLNTKNLQLVELKPDWRTQFLAVITDPSVAYILLMIGVYGIFFEFFNPGFIVPGVVGAICLVIGLYSLALLPVNYAGLALLILGIAFIIAEVFMPSFGILGIGGAISFVVGSIFLLKAEYGAFQLPLYTIIPVTIVTLGFLFLVIGMLVRSRKRPSVSGIELLKGKVGAIEVDTQGRLWMSLVGERWQCKSTSALQNGQQVIVKNIEGLTLEVEPFSKNKEEKA